MSLTMRSKWLRRFYRRPLTQARGRHDRWSTEGEARRITFVFLCVGQSSVDPAKMSQYTLGLTTLVHFGNASLSVVRPQASNLHISRVIAKVHNPVPNQRVVVDSIRVGDLEVLLESGIPIEALTHGSVDMGPIEVRNGEAIHVGVKCYLEKRRRW